MDQHGKQKPETDRFAGQSVKVTMSSVTEEGYALLRQSDAIPGEANFYN